MTQDILIALIPLIASIAPWGTSVEKTALAFLGKEKQSKIWMINGSEIRKKALFERNLNLLDVFKILSNPALLLVVWELPK